MTTTSTHQRATLEPSMFEESDLELLASFLHRTPSGTKRTPAALLAPDGKKQVIPFALHEALTTIVDALRQNKGISIIPTNTPHLTTQQAADYLQVSRPTLVKILESGTIPFTTVGRHRRVLLTDLIRYEDQLRRERRSYLKSQTHQATADNNYFDH